jgi:hypothetical protein
VVITRVSLEAGRRRHRIQPGAAAVEFSADTMRDDRAMPVGRAILKS